MSYIKGNFRKYIFRSDNGYVVGLFKVKEASSDIIELEHETITFTGYFHELNENDTYLFNGELVFHDRYGEQFSVSDYDIVLPEEKDKVIEFLSSDLFKGIGEKKAIKIVSTLGEDCLNKILDDKNILLTVKTVTEKQRDIIYDSLKKYQNSFAIVMELTNLGFSTKNSLNIYNKYKDRTLDLIYNDPYELTYSINDINFNTIEKVRTKLNIKEDDINRLKAGIIYLLKLYSFNTGNTYISYLELINLVKRNLFILNEEKIKDSINELIDDVRLIFDEENIYLKTMYEAEEYIANRLYYLTNKQNEENDIKSDLLEAEKYFNINYNDIQKKAITKAINNNLLIITGGPGTGKTTIIKSICYLYQQINKLSNKDLLNELYLLAPTGRASKRISEQTNLPAYTIHRFLKWNKEDNSFRINSENKSKAKIVIIDEASMIDTELFYNLLLGLERNCKIILIGDSNQLPSVGPGQILKDLIESDIIDTIKLKELYRQDKNSNINILAHNIINNIFDDNIFNEEDDLTFIEANSNNLKEFLQEYIITYKDYDFNNIQVMAPIYKGDNGIDELNYFIQNIINKKAMNKNEITFEGVTFRENDKVLQLTNMPDDNIFNGDIGIIDKISNKPKELLVNFYNEEIRYTPNLFSNLKLGYTISIHKSQGSEFDIVILPVLNVYKNMLYKKLIYTAATRARKKLIIIGEKTALQKAILNDKENVRKTSLKKFLISCIK